MAPRAQLYIFATALLLAVLALAVVLQLSARVPATREGFEQSVESGHFIAYYHRPEHEDAARELLAQSELLYPKVVEWLGQDLGGKTTLYYSPEAEEFACYVGVAYDPRVPAPLPAGAALEGEVYVREKAPSPERSVQVARALYTWTVEFNPLAQRRRVAPWPGEGFASFVIFKALRQNPHPREYQAVAVAARAARPRALFTLAELDGLVVGQVNEGEKPLLLGQAASLYYFLEARYGERGVRALLQELERSENRTAPALERALGVKAEEVERKWLAALRAAALNEERWKEELLAVERLGVPIAEANLLAQSSTFMALVYAYAPLV